MSDERQTVIPGTEEDPIPDLTEAGVDYRAKRDARMEAGKVEKEAKALLMQKMNDKGMRYYRDATTIPPLYVLVEQGDAEVKVSSKDPRKSEED